jgi:two-component system chemotaxis response regulator CheB
LESYKILVVEDSILIRQILLDILKELPFQKEIEAAKDGNDAIDKFTRFKPDLVTLDIEMPGLNGLQVLDHIMKVKPIPVIMLSALTQEGAEVTLKALEIGAVDFITKPQNLNFSIFKRELLEKAESLKLSGINIKRNEYLKTHGSLTGKAKLVTIGTSTGGPKALNYILTRLPKNYPAPILIVQHMPSGFTKSLAERLDKLCNIKVYEAFNEQLISSGSAYIAPGGFQLGIYKDSQSLKVQITDGIPALNYNPSYNFLLESLYKNSIGDVLNIVLTGMGTDGTEGTGILKKLPNIRVIAQNQESSVVFGMPKSIIQKNFADDVLSLEEIPEAMLKYVKNP